LIRAGSDSGKADALVLSLFDLRCLDEEAISAAPLCERKEHLRDLLSNAGAPFECGDHQVGQPRGVVADPPAYELI
jgi:ATP-dependent DNA ligase